MRALITGASGQVGGALASSVPAGWACKTLTRFECDLTNATAIRDAIAAYRPDVLINAAAYTAVDRAESDEALATAINGAAPGIMREALAEHGGRLIHLSTDFVFDGAASTPYRPDDSTGPLSAYGRSKLAGELAAGSDALILRTSWVYAAGGANFVRTMLRLMRERDEVRVVADQIGAPTWATGLAQTVWSLAQTDKTGILHHRDAGAASWYDFAVAIQEEALALGLLDNPAVIVPIATVDYPTPARRPAYSLLDDADTRSALGDRPPHWRENLRRMLKEENALG